jgi:hypothetical protein
LSLDHARVVIRVRVSREDRLTVPLRLFIDCTIPVIEGLVIFDILCLISKLVGQLDLLLFNLSIDFFVNFAFFDVHLPNGISIPGD